MQGYVCATYSTRGRWCFRLPLFLGVLLSCVVSVCGALRADAQTSETPTTVVTLDACYQAALKQSETIAISEGERRLAALRYSRAFDHVLPKLNAALTETLQDDASGSDSGVESSFARRHQTEVTISASETLFQGFREFYAIRGSKLDREVALQKKRDAERLLFRDVAQTYHAIAKVEHDMSALKHIIDVMNETARVLNERVTLGKNRASEAASERAQVALYRADLESLKGERAVLYEAMSFLTGWVPHPPLVTKGALPMRVDPLETYLARADDRPDVEASRGEAAMSDLNVKFERAALFPKAGVNFTAYPYREGFLQDVAWDTTFSLEVPVFNWGNIGLFREAKVRATQSGLRAEEKKRTAIKEIRRAYAAYHAAKETLVHYTRAVSESERALKFEQDDRANGLVVPLDVLAAEERLLEAMKRKNEAELAVWLDWTALHIASGLLPETFTDAQPVLGKN